MVRMFEQIFNALGAKIKIVTITHSVFELKSGMINVMVDSAIKKGILEVRVEY
jgi:hypothetical protein